MPTAMEKKLRLEALKRRLNGKQKDAFIYDTMRKTGWRPGQSDNSNNNQLRSS